MNCEEYQEQISAEIDGELDAIAETALWQHLASCAACRDWRHDLLSIRREFRLWPEEPLPAESKTLIDPAAHRERMYRIPPALAWAAGLALLIGGTAIGIHVGRGRTEPSQTPPADARQVETIVLTARDRVAYSVEDRRPTVVPQPPRPKSGG
ncbi:MAG: zf-HC2 domain-containing protein [candidate division Zixibacteria bacterium]|nr:zf-HC2 domain-containing protein [candidate division Zixibacteria bacterium]